MSASMPRAVLLVLGLGVAFLEPHGVSAFAPSAMMRLGHRRISASQRPSQRTSLRMCLGEKPPGQDSDEKNPAAAGGEDDGGPLAGVFRFAMQPITLPLVGSVATLFAGSLVMTLSLAFVVVHWAVSPPTGLALGGTPPPGIARTEQRQVVLSQKAVLFEEVPPACRCSDSPLFVGPWVCTALRWASGGSVQKRGALRRRFGPGMVSGVWWQILRHGTQPPFADGRCEHLLCSFQSSLRIYERHLRGIWVVGKGTGFCGSCPLGVEQIWQSCFFLLFVADRFYIMYRQVF